MFSLNSDRYFSNPLEVDFSQKEISVLLFIYYHQYILLASIYMLFNF